MLKLLNINRVQGTQRKLVRPVLPVRILINNNVTIEYSDGSKESPACLRCPDAPCCRYQADELQLSDLMIFPGDSDLSICPTGALDWPIDSDDGPSIDAAHCIGCGLCVQRCPVGAIQLGIDGIAKVLDNDTRTLKRSELAETESTRSAFIEAVRVSQMAIISDNNIERLTDRISSKGINNSGPKFPNLFTRNLLKEVGWNASMRRAGDTNVRMDVIAQSSGLICVTEVEFSDAVIDAPRNVLDGIAVLRMRYGLSKLTAGLVVVYALPNQRSEYWHVISDIEKILDVRIYTISATALILLLWEGCTLNHLPFASLEKASIRSDIEKNLNRTLPLSLGIAGVLEVPK